MFDIWASVASLGQPCLYRNLNNHLINDEGIVRPEVLTGIDRLLCENLLGKLQSFEAPENCHHLNADQRFLNISALQKSIRRGDSAEAMRFALQGCQLDREQVFRRLAVCALEDVGLGNLVAVATALAVMGNRRLRHFDNSNALAALIARELAESPKSRLACDLISIVDYDPSLAPYKSKLVVSPVEDLRELAEDKVTPVANRMLAAWLLAGTRRFAGASMPTTPKRSRTDIMKMMTASPMPLILYYVADRAAARLGEAMFISLFFMAELTNRDLAIDICSNDPAASTCIAGFPAAAYDLHTREGRAALIKLENVCSKEFSDLDLPEKLKFSTAVAYGVFILEGGLLRRKLICAELDAIEKAARRAELACTGMRDAGEQEHFLEVLAANLPLLDFLRESSV